MTLSCLARAVVVSCSCDVEEGVFNIGSMEGTSVEMIANRLRTAAGIEARIIEDASRRRPCEVLRLVADNRRAKLLLGWQPEVGLVDGLRSVLENRRIDFARKNCRDANVVAGF